MDGTNIGPYLPPVPPPLPIHITGLAKVSCQEPIFFYKDTCLIIFHDLYKKDQKDILKLIKIVYWVMDGTNIGPYLPPVPP